MILHPCFSYATLFGKRKLTFLGIAMPLNILRKNYSESLISQNTKDLTVTEVTMPKYLNTARFAECIDGKKLETTSKSTRQNRNLS